MNKKEIRAVYSEKTIRVYQAYCDDIADEAIGLGTFGKKFKMDRMTWIKDVSGTQNEILMEILCKSVRYN